MSSVTMDDWDLELAAVQRDLARLDHYLSAAGSSSNQLTTHKVRLLQSHLRFERLCDQMHKILERDFLLVPREKAIVHWTKIYLEKVKVFYTLQQKSMTRGLWLKLLRARMMGGETTEKSLRQEPDSEDLVALALKHAQLQKTEQHLQVQLKILSARKNDLREQYYKLGVVEANNGAGRSFNTRVSRESESDGLESALQTLGRALVYANWSHGKDPLAQEFSDHLEMYANKAEETLSHCHQLTLARFSDGPHRTENHAEGELQRAVQQLDELDGRVEEAYQKLIAKPLLPMRPILVQKSMKPDKKEALERVKSEK